MNLLIEIWGLVYEVNDWRFEGKSLHLFFSLCECAVKRGFSIFVDFVFGLCCEHWAVCRGSEKHDGNTSDRTWPMRRKEIRLCFGRQPAVDDESALILRKDEIYTKSFTYSLYSSLCSIIFIILKKFFIFLFIILKN